ncbi:hypothetical protein ONZ45_g15297 [Pleurotus djamor]|nr:hypothetical protein ONZ45_g15297 [Pleurotus djamor]
MFPTFVSYPSSTPGYLPPYPLRRGYGPAPVVSDTSGLRERYLAAAAEARLAQAQYLAAAASAEAETHSSAFYDPYRNVQETYPHPFYTPDRFEHARHPDAGMDTDTITGFITLRRISNPTIRISHLRLILVPSRNSNYQDPFRRNSIKDSCVAL